ncbi:bifunctional arginine demethylase and lysyl-hydroxylase JMJD6-like isoform X2 [Ptychodera flava]|uniref:bifunctional arginine demethylase and lysyl-hydroxylase JMJD6-like isoform X2 n=1 Tax=Ptychodera flava TaxID=63121 RepID=UPI00396A22A5
MTVKQRHKVQQKNMQKASHGKKQGKEHNKSDKTEQSTVEEIQLSRKNSSSILIAAAVLFVIVIVCFGSLWSRSQKTNFLESHYTIFNIDSTKPELGLQEKLAFYNVTYSLNHIDRRSNLSLQEYLDVYDAKWPVLVTDVVPKWPAFNKWSGKFFKKNYHDVRVAMKAVDGKLEKAESLALPLHLFVDHVHEGRPNVWTYLEDELFIKQRPELMADIGEVIYLQEDFFKLFPEEVRPWDAMLLWGTAHSRSSLHIDPYNWTGTNAVLKGIKRWKLYPPGQDHYLYVMEDQRSGFPLDCYKYNRIVLHEILIADNIEDQDLPFGFESMSPRQQVETVMSLLPKEILRKGKEVTEKIMKQVAGEDLYKQRLP